MLYRPENNINHSFQFFTKSLIEAATFVADAASDGISPLQALRNTQQEKLTFDTQWRLITQKAAEFDAGFTDAIANCGAELSRVSAIVQGYIQYETDPKTLKQHARRALASFEGRSDLLSPVEQMMGRIDNAVLVINDQTSVDEKLAVLFSFSRHIDAGRIRFPKMSYKGPFEVFEFFPASIPVRYISGGISEQIGGAKLQDMARQLVLSQIAWLLKNHQMSFISERDVSNRPQGSFLLEPETRKNKMEVLLQSVEAMPITQSSKNQLKRLVSAHMRTLEAARYANMRYQNSIMYFIPAASEYRIADLRQENPEVIAQIQDRLTIQNILEEIRALTDSILEVAIFYTGLHPSCDYKDKTKRIFELCRQLTTNYSGYFAAEEMEPLNQFEVELGPLLEKKV